MSSALWTYQSLQGCFMLELQVEQVQHAPYQPRPLTSQRSEHVLEGFTCAGQMFPSLQNLGVSHCQCVARGRLQTDANAASASKRTTEELSAMAAAQPVAVNCSRATPLASIRTRGVCIGGWDAPGRSRCLAGDPAAFGADRPSKRS